LVGGSAVAAQHSSDPSEIADDSAIHEKWSNCLVEALAAFASLPEQPNVIIDASLGKCRSIQDQAMAQILSTRRRAGFPVDGPIIKELTRMNVQGQRDWMLPALLEMKLNGLAPRN
jgi:hypothetical protein